MGNFLFGKSNNCNTENKQVNNEPVPTIQVNKTLFSHKARKNRITANRQIEQDRKKERIIERRNASMGYVPRVIINTDPVSDKAAGRWLVEV